jgi:hypothetical protein
MAKRPLVAESEIEAALSAFVYGMKYPDAASAKLIYAIVSQHPFMSVDAAEEFEGVLRDILGDDDDDIASRVPQLYAKLNGKYSEKLQALIAAATTKNPASAPPALTLDTAASNAVEREIAEQYVLYDGGESSTETPPPEDDVVMGCTPDDIKALVSSITAQATGKAKGDYEEAALVLKAATSAVYKSFSSTAGSSTASDALEAVFSMLTAIGIKDDSSPLPDTMLTVSQALQTLEKAVNDAASTVTKKIESILGGSISEVRALVNDLSSRFSANTLLGTPKLRNALAEVVKSRRSANPEITGVIATELVDVAARTEAVQLLKDIKAVCKLTNLTPGTADETRVTGMHVKEALQKLQNSSHGGPPSGPGGGFRHPVPPVPPIPPKHSSGRAPAPPTHPSASVTAPIAGLKNTLLGFVLYNVWERAMYPETKSPYYKKDGYATAFEAARRQHRIRGGVFTSSDIVRAANKIYLSSAAAAGGRGDRQRR